jgi:Transposase
MGHKYVGLDVHQSSTVAAVHDERGKSVMESILATKAEAIGDFLKGLRGTIHVTFEEGTQAGWLYEIVKPVVAEVIVCNPRRNKLLAVGNKADRVDAQKLAELLRCGQLKPVYHGTPGVRRLKELVHSYDSLVGDTIRVMNRVKAIYRGRAIGCAGRDVYYQRNREQWLEKLSELGVRQRAVFLYRQLDTLRGLRREAKKAMLKESGRHPAYLPDLETDSRAGSDSNCPDPGEGSQSAPVSDQAAVLGLLRVGGGDPFECGLPVSRRQGREAKAATDDTRIESELQSSTEVRVQECRRGWDAPDSVRRLLCRIAGEGDAPGIGSTDAGEKDRGGYVDVMEARGTIR